DRARTHRSPCHGDADGDAAGDPARLPAPRRAGGRGTGRAIPRGRRRRPRRAVRRLTGRSVQPAVATPYPALSASRSPVWPAATARRPRTSTYAQNAASTAAPIATLTGQGSADPVTNPSTSPDTASTPTRPIATVN